MPKPLWKKIQMCCVQDSNIGYSVSQMSIPSICLQIASDQLEKIYFSATSGGLTPTIFWATFNLHFLQIIQIFEFWAISLGCCAEVNAVKHDGCLKKLRYEFCACFSQLELLQFTFKGQIGRCRIKLLTWAWFLLVMVERQFMSETCMLLTGLRAYETQSKQM